MGKWRLITDLSFTTGSSLNDGINSDYCSLECTSVDRVASHVMSLGRGVLIVKIDIKSAYRFIPVFPHRQASTWDYMEGHVLC